jgi:TolB-like protein
MLLRILAFSCCCALALVACERPPAAAIGIAVLPFESLSPEKENAFFADGVYGVSTELARVANLKVISHNSVAKYVGARNAKEIGRALNVAVRARGRRAPGGRQHPSN